MNDADPRRAFRDQLDVNLVGVWNTVQAAAPLLIEQKRGGAVVLTSSAFGLTGRGGDGTGGSDGYVASKHGVVGLMRTFATWLAPHGIRVNCVNPTGVATRMVLNPAVEALFGGGSEPSSPSPSRSTTWRTCSTCRWSRSTTSPPPWRSWPPTRPATSPGSRCRSTPDAGALGVTACSSRVSESPSRPEPMSPRYRSRGLITSWSRPGVASEERARTCRS